MSAMKAKIPTGVISMMGLDDARFDGRYTITDDVIETDRPTALAMAYEAEERANGTGGWAESEHYTTPQRRALRTFAKRLFA